MKLSIDLHFSRVVTANIGGERRLKRAVIGDKVNVASRFKQLTCKLDVGIVVSDNFVSTTRQSGKLNGSSFVALKRGLLQAIGRRDANIDVWTLSVV